MYFLFFIFGIWKSEFPFLYIWYLEVWIFFSLYLVFGSLNFLFFIFGIWKWNRQQWTQDTEGGQINKKHSKLKRWATGTPHKPGVPQELAIGKQFLFLIRHCPFVTHIVKSEIRLATSLVFGIMFWPDVIFGTMCSADMVVCSLHSPYLVFGSLNFLFFIFCNWISEFPFLYIWYLEVWISFPLYLVFEI
jgi:hypothetical protein